MTIPRRLGPETGPRTALPDYARSSATVERMVAALDPARTGRERGRVRALLPAHATRDTVARAVVAAALLGTALVSVLGMVLLLGTVPDGRSPGLGLLVVVGALGALALLLGMLGGRFGIVALGTARARVEISADGLRVVGPVRHRDVAWERIAAIESRVVHPVHWLTAALRLEDGTRIVMPAFDRPVWTWTRPSGQDIRALRTELHRRRQAGPGRRWEARGRRAHGAREPVRDRPADAADDVVARVQAAGAALVPSSHSARTTSGSCAAVTSETVSTP